MTKEPEVHPRRWAMLGVLVVSLLVIVLDNTVLNVATKTIADPREGLGASQSDLEWAINAYTLVFAGLLFTFGVLGDRVGRKRVLLAGMAVFGLASLASAYARTPEQLLWGRALMGLGGAAIMPQTLSIITNVFPEDERARAIGIWSGGVGLGIAIGPITGGLLLDHFWWGSVFLLNVPIVAVGLVGMSLLIPESRNPRPGGLDPLGVLLSIAGLVLLCYGIIEGGEKGAWLEPSVLGPIALGLAALAWFAAHEARTDHPAFDVRLFGDPRLSAAVAAIGLTFFAVAGMVFFGSFYLQAVRGLSPMQAGSMMLPMAAAQLIFAPRSAATVRRFGPKAVCAAGLLLVAAAMFGFLLLNETTPLWVFAAIGFTQGSGIANIMPPATESVMSALPRERAGAGSAVTNTVRQVCLALGIAVSGSVVSSLYRDGLSGPLAELPAPLRETAGESLASTLQVVERTGARELLGPAYTSFLHGVHVSAAGSGTVALLGALAVLRWMPGRPSPQAPRSRGARETEKAGV